MIELSIDDSPALFLALSADGTVNRAGNGKASPGEKDVYIARTDGSLFREMAGLVDSSWLGLAGVYEIPGQVGPYHQLRLSLLCADRPPVALGFAYRVDTSPPPEFATFVQRAIEVTQPWYDNQRQIVAASVVGRKENSRTILRGNPKRKRWWKLW
jgi:hypothetical protein